METQGTLTVKWNVPPDRILQAALTDGPPSRDDRECMILEKIHVDYSFPIPQAVTRDVYNRFMDSLDKLIMSHMESLGAEIRR